MGKKVTNTVDIASFGTDAAKWTEALAARLGELGNDALDFAPGSDLFGWVANMIEAGRSAGYAKGQEDLTKAADFFANFDNDMRDGEKLTIVFVGGQAVGKSIMARRISEALAEYEIDASHTVVKWPNGGDYDVVTVTLDREDKAALAKAKFVDATRVLDFPAPGEGVTLDGLDPDPLELARRLPVGLHHVDRANLSAWFGLAIEAGALRSRKRGLNEVSGLPVLNIPDVNSVEIDIAGQLLAMTVDGQVRVTVGAIDRLFIVDGNTKSRFVVLRDGAPLEALPNTMEVASVDIVSEPVGNEQ